MILYKQTFGFNVDVEVGNDYQCDDEHRWNQYAGNDWRKVMEHLLQAEEIPRSLGGIWSMRRICEALERRVEQKRYHDQDDCQKFDSQDGPEQNFRIRLNLIFVGGPHLGRGPSCYEDNTPGCLANVGAEASNKVFLVAHRISFVVVSGCSACTGFGSLGCE